MKLTLLQALAAANGAPVAVRATMTITTVAKASLIDGETFTLHNYLGKAFVFEFTFPAAVVAAGNIPVDISADTTADQVRDRIIAVINALASQLGFTAASGGAATVTITQDDPGPHGNQKGNSDTVANGGFVVGQFSNGALPGVPLRSPENALVRGESLGAMDEATIKICSSGATGTASIAFARLWGYSLAMPPATRQFFPLGSGTDADKGKLNAGSALGETLPDVISHSQCVRKLRSLDRIYLELGAFTTAGVVDAVLEGGTP